MFDTILEKEFYSEKEAADTIRPIIDAIKYCHSHNIIHRDIKVYLQRYSSYFSLKIFCIHRKTSHPLLSRFLILVLPGSSVHQLLPQPHAVPQGMLPQRFLSRNPMAKNVITGVLELYSISCKVSYTKQLLDFADSHPSTMKITSLFSIKLRKAYSTSHPLHGTISPQRLLTLSKLYW